MRLTVTDAEKSHDVILGAEKSVHSAMEIMNETGRTLLFICEGDRLVGLAADGDVRRFLAAGGETSDPISDAMNRSPRTVPAGISDAEIRSYMMRNQIESVPVISGDRLVAVARLEMYRLPGDLVVVIMAGGLGSRLAPFTDECPKPLLHLAGKPILTHLLEGLRDQGIYRFVLSVNHLSHMIVDHYDDGSALNVAIDYVHEREQMGTGGALSLIDRASLSDPFVLINGDLIHDIDIAALLDHHAAAGWEATMVVRRHWHTIPYGVVEVDTNSEFEGIREKPTDSVLINAGVYALSRSSLDLVPPNTSFDLPALFPQLREQQRPCGTYVHEGRWIDVGTRAEFDRADEILRSEVSK